MDSLENIRRPTGGGRAPCRKSVRPEVAPEFSPGILRAQWWRLRFPGKGIECHEAQGAVAAGRTSLVKRLAPDSGSLLDFQRVRDSTLQAALVSAKRGPVSSLTFFLTYPVVLCLVYGTRQLR
jgi:hypothetical protein